ncbi:AAA family ATPase [Pasteurella atlantica]|uniref:AAA family ATPase n=3 Tax=Pasteurellaceae TaxID=712 RepID=A0AAQ4LZ45_9PAST|nr:AAA family ATPase [Pasteurella atlantica]MBR0573790.1 AAA family ATPase [Pasteurella atlantica]MDP8032999.1 AAA family ATPase [Pasteurella atlantica]MDP8034844.1 AAA family ATPase [Pasteurella atlantica]MDP8036886.1 AAA family ATPase [Pasteurella atlantica]MDP8039726.1 AAA family ATPase [Pasteurella atlantica]
MDELELQGTLQDIAQHLKNKEKKVQLIYAFNGSGKTRLSREFKQLIFPKHNTDENVEQIQLARTKILYYNAFTEDLFYWNNDLNNDAEPILNIQLNTFTEWVLKEQGQDQNVIDNFQYYTNDKLTPRFDENFSKITFSFTRGDDSLEENIKISKGEESNFIWSIFYTLIQLVISELNTAEPEDRSTNQFDELEYIFIDDPVSSLDENHLIQLAVDLAQLIKSSKSEIKFIITTHNPLFYNILHNELNRDDKPNKYKKKELYKYQLNKREDGTYELIQQQNDSPFSYHLYLKKEIEKAIENNQLKKYHFNFLRNILEKTSTFLGYQTWGELLPQNNDGLPNPYEARIINFSSHSKHSSEETVELSENDKKVLKGLVEKLNKMYQSKLDDD